MVKGHVQNAYLSMNYMIFENMYNYVCVIMQHYRYSIDDGFVGIIIRNVKLLLCSFPTHFVTP